MKPTTLLLVVLFAIICIFATFIGITWLNESSQNPMEIKILSQGGQQPTQIAYADKNDLDNVINRDINTEMEEKSNNIIIEVVVKITATPMPTATPKPVQSVNTSSSIQQNWGYTGNTDFNIDYLLNIFPNGVPTLSEDAKKYFGGNQVAAFLMDLYKELEDKTGISAAIWAGIHFEEGSNGSQASLVNGYNVGSPDPQYGKTYGTVANTVDPAIGFLKGKLGSCGWNGDPSSIDEEMISCALSYYNGGGNANCKHFSEGAFCPRKYIGYDDPYVYNKFDQVHNDMRLIYCADYKTCMETQGSYPKRKKPGALTFALWFYWTYMTD